MPTGGRQLDSEFRRSSTHLPSCQKPQKGGFPSCSHKTRRPPSHVPRLRVVFTDQGVMHLMGHGVLGGAQCMTYSGPGREGRILPGYSGWGPPFPTSSHTQRR